MNLQQVVWPTMEELARLNGPPQLSVIQAQYGGDWYYRFAWDRAKAHPITLELVPRATVYEGYISGHPHALDVLVRDIESSGGNPQDIRIINGTNAYFKRNGLGSWPLSLNIQGTSTNFMRAKGQELEDDLKRTCPDYLHLTFK